MVILQKYLDRVKLSARFKFFFEYFFENVHHLLVKETRQFLDFQKSTGFLWDFLNLRRVLRFSRICQISGIYEQFPGVTTKVYEIFGVICSSHYPHKRYGFQDSIKTIDDYAKDGGEEVFTRMHCVL